MVLNLGQGSFHTIKSLYIFPYNLSLKELKNKTIFSQIIVFKIYLFIYWNCHISFNIFFIQQFFCTKIGIWVRIVIHGKHFHIKRSRLHSPWILILTPKLLKLPDNDFDWHVPYKHQFNKISLKFTNTNKKTETTPFRFSAAFR